MGRICDRKRIIIITVMLLVMVTANRAHAGAIDGISDYYSEKQWNLDVIGAEGAFENNHLGQGVRIGVLDSGINPHEDFGARLLPGHNYVENAAGETDTSDVLGHGTGVAGLIAGAGAMAISEPRLLRSWYR